MSSTSSLVLQTAVAGDEGLVDQINDILVRAGKTHSLVLINSDAQVGAKVLEAHVYAYTLEKNQKLVSEIEEAVRLFRDDVGEEAGQIVLLVSDDSDFTRVTRPGQLVEAKR